MATCPDLQHQQRAKHRLDESCARKHSAQQNIVRGAWRDKCLQGVPLLSQLATTKILDAHVANGHDSRAKPGFQGHTERSACLRRPGRSKCNWRTEKLQECSELGVRSKLRVEVSNFHSSGLGTQGLQTGFGVCVCHPRYQPCQNPRTAESPEAAIPHVSQSKMNKGTSRSYQACNPTSTSTHHPAPSTRHSPSTHHPSNLSSYLFIYLFIKPFIYLHKGQKLSRCQLKPALCSPALDQLLTPDQNWDRPGKLQTRISFVYIAGGCVRLHKPVCWLCPRTQTTRYRISCSKQKQQSLQHFTDTFGNLSKERHPQVQDPSFPACILDQFSCQTKTQLSSALWLRRCHGAKVRFRKLIARAELHLHRKPLAHVELA